MGDSRTGFKNDFQHFIPSSRENLKNLWHKSFNAEPSLSNAFIYRAMSKTTASHNPGVLPQSQLIHMEEVGPWQGSTMVLSTGSPQSTTVPQDDHISPCTFVHYRLSLRRRIHQPAFYRSWMVRRCCGSLEHRLSHRVENSRIGQGTRMITYQKGSVLLSNCWSCL